MALLVTLFLVLVNIFNAITTNSPKADGLNALQVREKYKKADHRHPPPRPPHLLWLKSACNTGHWHGCTSSPFAHWLPAPKNGLSQNKEVA